MSDSHRYVRRANTEAPYIDAEVMTADVTGDAIDCKHLSHVEIDCWWTDAGSPIGVIKVQGSADGVRWHTLTLAGAMLHAIGGDAALTAGVIDISGVGAGSVLIVMEGLPSYLRLWYDRTSAGTSDVFSAAVSGR